MSESENIRRPSGIEINGIPSADEIIALGRKNPLVATSLYLWKTGAINFDEALRIAVWRMDKYITALEQKVQIQEALRPVVMHLQVPKDAIERPDGSPIVKAGDAVFYDGQHYRLRDGTILDGPIEPKA